MSQELKVTLLSREFSTGDQEALAEIFTMPIAKEYLKKLANDVIVDLANLPVAKTREEVEAAAIQQAYSKGQLIAYYTLLSIEKAKPTNQPPRG